MKYTICEKCPCLNRDYEQGSDCNLGFNTDLEWLDKATGEITKDDKEMRSHQKDFDLKYVSRNCGLVKIVTSNGETFPEVVDCGKRKKKECSHE